MIELITGKPGSGKTYLAVQRMLELPVGKYVIWSNIAGLNVDSFPEPSMFKQIPDDIRHWCQKETQIEYAEACREKYGRPMLVVIDEAQMVFSEKDSGLKGWLSWHRHLGQDIWLIAQHNRMLHQDYVNLAEYEIRALKSSLLNMLVYQYRMGGEAFKTMRRRRDRRVFEAYRSFDQSEVAKASFKLYYWGLAALILVILSVLFFNNRFAAATVGVDRNREKLVGPGSSEKVKSVSPAGVKMAAPVVDKWETLSFAGVLGNKVLVQCSKGLVDLGDAVEAKYLMLEASSSGCIVWSEGKKRVLRRTDKGRQADEAKERGVLPHERSGNVDRGKQAWIGG